MSDPTTRAHAITDPSAELVEQARALVASVVVDEVDDVEPDEDLRDVGLDSIRLMSLLSGLRNDGVVVELDDVSADPTLRGLAVALQKAQAAA